MEIKLLGKSKIIMSNPYSKHNYFAWPTATRLQNGKIAVVASGFRLEHVCPFGKTVISYSEDDGETYTLPAPVIDTVLDDRDGGIVPFGKSGVIVTSFNNSIEFQKFRMQNRPLNSEYKSAYLELITKEEESKYLGALFRFSFDGGVTFGPICKSHITSPHGPIELKDGSLLWVGRTFSHMDAKMGSNDRIEAHKINLDGTTEFVGYIDNVVEDGEELLSCEPHVILLDDGRLLAHIRVQRNTGERILTIYQSESNDNGKTWSKPYRLLDKFGGAPSHLFRHSSGVLIATYGVRKFPYGIKAMFSYDDGKTWDIGHDIYVNEVSADLGYPSTVELKDGSLITVFYAREKAEESTVIMQQKWEIVK